MTHNARTTIKLVHVVSDAMAYTFFKGQLDFMREKGYDITFVASPSERLDRVAAEGIRVVGVPLARKISLFSDLKALWMLYRFLRSEKPDIVHAHTPKGGLIGSLAAFLARMPVRIYHIRGLPFMTATGLKRTILKTTERIACASAKNVLCVSHSIRKVAIQEGLCAADKIQVLLQGSGNGVAAKTYFNPAHLSETDTQALRAKHQIPLDATVLGFIGRIVKDKGIHELLSAFSQIQAKYANTYLLIIGILEEGDAISQEERELIENHSHIRFVGEQKQLLNWYGIMDLVVFPSYREGLPNVPLEAAAMELPVVAFDIPGCVDVIQHGETGILVPLKDLPAFTEAAENYVQNSNLRALHGKNARQFVLNTFDQHLLWQAYHHFYESLRK